MWMPGVLSESLLDHWMSDPFEREFFGRKPVCEKAERVPMRMKTDIRETEGTYELEVDLPGFKKADVTLQLDNGYLNIQASRTANSDEKDAEGKYIRRERYQGQCARSFYVGDRVRQEEIRARFEDGILKISVPREDPKAVEQKKYIAIEG
ncbi:MAG: Hsp20/alpha crystallin family protein [Lachnospiraceae bacterium]|nr:Hsp20/alpha crystallin family protein [Lachnospiraceae bacterium]